MTVEQYAKVLNVPRGRVAVITGGNSGVGFEFARHIARLGWRIILAVRSLERGERAKERLKAEFPGGEVSVRDLDLANKESVASFCSSLIRDNVDVDVFYCNAGVYRIPYSMAYDGFEMTIAVNYVSNLLLFEDLRSYLMGLPHPVKWILTSSVVARHARLTEQDFWGGKRYDKIAAYNRSKVAVNQLFLHLIDECEGTNVLPLLVHPGITFTPLIQKAYSKKPVKLASQRFFRTFFHKPDKAALSTLYLCQEGIKSPCLCGPRSLFHASGFPKIYRLYRGNLKRYKETIAKTFSRLNTSK